MSFFSRFKKEQPIQQPMSQAPNLSQPTIVISPDDALPSIKGETPNEVKDVKEEMYDTYEEEEIEGNPNIGGHVKEEEEIEDEDLDKEEREIEEKIKLLKLKRVEAQRRKEMEERQQQEAISTQQPQYIPIYLSEAELMREVMKKLTSIEMWAQELTTLLKERKL